MSPIGKWLLNNCSNNLSINLDDPVINRKMVMMGFKYLKVRLAAIHLGIRLEGGS